MRDETIGEEIRQMIADVGLPHKRTTLAKELSGNTTVLLCILCIFSS